MPDVQRRYVRSLAVSAVQFHTIVPRPGGAGLWRRLCDSRPYNDRRHDARVIWTATKPEPTFRHCQRCRTAEEALA